MDFKNKKIAVVGASEDQSKYGHRIFKDLVSKGYSVWPVNPRGGQILGKTVYKNLAELPSKPDLVITVVQPQVTEQIVEECCRLNLEHIWMQPGSESEKAVSRARDYGITVTTACFMVSQQIW
ncbi:MAG: CoA-binding protein [Elusimicrobiota bacterium]